MDRLIFKFTADIKIIELWKEGVRVCFKNNVLKADMV